MPKKRYGEIALPDGWEECRDFDGKVFYIDHHTRQTSWIDPRDSLTKPQSFADCVGDELPYGWEQCYDEQIGIYFIDHINQVNQLEDPRQQWRSQQERMLKDYLVTAQDDLAAKKEIYTVKEQRLVLAQDEFQHLHDTLASWKSSRTSLNSNSSVGSTKYDPDLLKAEVNLSKNRVARLKRELDQIRAEMCYKEQGVETLTRVDEKLSGQNGSYNVSQAQAMVQEIHQLQNTLSSKAQEKISLMECLARLKDDFLRNKNGGSSPDVSTLSIPHVSNTASQTDLRGELGPGSSRYIEEVTRLQLQYQEARSRLLDSKHKLAMVEDQMVPGQNESDKDRLMLLQEKEQLLRELKSIDHKGRSEEEVYKIRAQIHQLEQDLVNAVEISNKQIADRIKLQEQKSALLQELSEITRLTTLLESQLKSLSVSTLSMSSGSSLGSLGSLSSCSRSSLTSLNMTDIYQQQQSPSTSLHDLHRRLEKLLQGHSVSPIHEQPNQVGLDRLDTTSAATRGYLQSVMASNNELSNSFKSSISSLSSMSPPVSPYDMGAPPSYLDHIASVERQKQTYGSNTSLTHPSAMVAPNTDNNQSKILAETSSNFSYQNNVDSNSANRAGMLFSANISRTPSTLAQGDHGIDPNSQGLVPKRVMLTQYPDNMDILSNPPLSPISESSSGVYNHINVSGGNTQSVSAAVSDESVAGDSGVFEASVNVAKKDVTLAMNLESAQIQIKLRYESTEGHLVVGVEQARNLSALAFPQGSRVCIKAALLPQLAGAAWETQPSSDLKTPRFCQVFRVAIPEAKLLNKTLQVNVWSIHSSEGNECLGCAQVSLADFDPKCPSVRWYNVLSFKFMQSDTVSNKEDTSKEEVTHDSKEVKTTSHKHSSSSSTQSASSQPEQVDKVKQLLEASSARLRKAVSADNRSASSDSSRDSSHYRGTHPAVISLKEESSDESTIISSQTSTLTRNQGPEDMEGHKDAAYNYYMGHGDEEDEEDIEDEADYNEQLQIQEIMEEFEQFVEDSDSHTDQEDEINTCDKETNTDGIYAVQPTIKRAPVSSTNSRSSTIRRSQTFSPACRPGISYVCKLNRSDSDSAVPNFKRGPFQRHSIERRSLRWKRSTVSGSKGERLPPRTSLDLELDLQASQIKLSHLDDELSRLREIKKRLEQAKAKGETELPVWLSDDEHFQKLLTEADKMAKKDGQKLSKQDRRAEHLLRKVTKDVQKLKRTSPNSNANSFKEKMAFFTTVNMNVPVVPPECNQDEARMDDFLKDDRLGQQV